MDKTPTLYLEANKSANSHSGLGQFCYQLSTSIQALGKQTSILAYEDEKAQIFADGTSYLKLTRLNRLQAPKLKQPAIWHALHQDSPYVFPKRNCKVVLTIHDLNFLQKYSNPLKRQLRLNKLQRKVTKADVIVCISEYTAQEVSTYLRLGDKPIHVIYNGCNLPKHTQFTAPDALPTGKFLFSIGVLQARKNFKVLLPMLVHLPNLHVYIAGDKENDTAKELLEIAQKNGVANRFTLLGKISEETKWWYYQHCEAFVFPSLSEGFGLPILEAMSLGKPCILSKASCLPEIGGESAFYWANFEPEHMAKTVLEAIEKTNSTKNAAWAHEFSWHKAALQYQAVYDSLT